MERGDDLRVIGRFTRLTGLSVGALRHVDEMIHAAHASRFHWSRAEGAEPANAARGEWQCSRVYAVLGRAEPSLWHAKRCLEIVEANGIADSDLAAGTRR